METERRDRRILEGTTGRSGSGSAGLRSVREVPDTGTFGDSGATFTCVGGSGNRRQCTGTFKQGCGTHRLFSGFLRNPTGTANLGHLIGILRYPGGAGITKDQCHRQPHHAPV